jgi:hypothetical protein
MVPALDESPTFDKTLRWLLEPSDPSSRYLTLTRVLGHPESDPDVRVSRAAIPKASPAREILNAQYPQGYWMHPGIGFSPRYRATVWQILFLAQLGKVRCEALDRAVAHLFEVNQRRDGAFRASKERGDTPLWLNGSLLWALETLGYGDRKPVMRAWAWLARQVMECGFGPAGATGERCPRAAVKVLWAANAAGERRWNAAVESVRRVAVDSLLEEPQAPGCDDARWLRLVFPLAADADMLQWLTVLTEAGCGDDPRVERARSWVAQKKLPDGRWPLERVPGKMWADFGKVGQPNKWVTLRVVALGR